MMRFLVPLLASLATPAAVQDRPDIVVNAPDRAAQEKAARAFVKAVGVAQGNTPAARWVEPVCPRAIGLTVAGAAALVEARVRAVAEAAGIPVAPAGCTANLAIAFVGDARATMRRIVARDSRRLASVPMQDRSLLVDGTAPIRWWYAIGTEARDGMSPNARTGPVASDATPAALAGGGEGGGSAVPMRDGVTTIMQPRASLISTLAARVIRSATVVVDVPAADGIPLESVASYAAMVGLAEVRPTTRTPEDSILSLFADPNHPRLPTDRDLALLRTIYAIPLDRSAMMHRGLVARGLLKLDPKR